MDREAAIGQCPRAGWPSFDWGHRPAGPQQPAVGTRAQIALLPIGRPGLLRRGGLVHSLHVGPVGGVSPTAIGDHLHFHRRLAVGLAQLADARDAAHR